jgi:hypothetical protein
LIDIYTKIETRVLNIIETIGDKFNISFLNNNSKTLIRYLLSEEKGKRLPLEIFSLQEIRRLKIDKITKEIIGSNKIILINIFFFKILKEILIDQKNINKNINSNTRNNFKVIASIIFHSISEYIESKIREEDGNKEITLKEYIDSQYNYDNIQNDEEKIDYNQEDEYENIDFRFRIGLNRIKKKKELRIRTKKTQRKEEIQTLQEILQIFETSFKEEYKESIDLKPNLFTKEEIGIFFHLAKERNVSIIDCIDKTINTIMNKVLM